MTAARVRPPIEPLTEQDARHLLAAGLLQPCHLEGPTRVALRIGCDEKTVRKARDKETTLRLDYAWNALLADERALDALARHFRRLLIPLAIEGANDFQTVSAMLHAATEYFDRMRDNERCHKDTLALGDLFRPLLPALAAVVHEADEIRLGNAASKRGE
ncbi:MAG: hypothetical protein QOH47_2390 [Sphingomonadales bacterium]|jgi:hypothetical protein|nr:hypothetical protein [Sphingomonadales bacterium]